MQANRKTWDRVLDAARATHEDTPALTAFCPFPDDITAQEVTAFAIPAADLLAREAEFGQVSSSELCQAFRAAGPLAQWRETYKGTAIAQDFMDRFACYCLIGKGGAFHSDQMWAWVVYMPPWLYYPWHHHPGEEMYTVIGGEAVFMAQGVPDKTLRVGQTCLHASNQPHAMETQAHPVMAYVVWRNGFETPPVLTPEGVRKVGL